MVRIPVLLLSLTAAALAVTGCGDDAPGQALLPRDGDDVTAEILDELPAGAAPCAADQGWEGDPEVVSIVSTPAAITVVATGEKGGNPITAICDYSDDGTLLTTDPLTSTGTDQPVGNDYIDRVGSVLGRVDVGIPEDAVTATYDLGEYTITFDDLEDLTLLRLHGLEGGNPEDGFQMGAIRFENADGGDVTVASIPLPTMVHGAPRQTDGS